VADNGQGIPPSLLSHVFDRFWRAPNSDQRTLGTGLGLSIVKELVTLHGGTVVTYSAGIGEGSAFTMQMAYARTPGYRYAGCNSSLLPPNLKYCQNIGLRVGPLRVTGPESCKG
jgi:hypothetical protein